MKNFAKGTLGMLCMLTMAGLLTGCGNPTSSVKSETSAASSVAENSTVSSAAASSAVGISSIKPSSSAVSSVAENQIGISQKFTLGVGDTIQLYATGLLTGETAAWSSSKTEVATVAEGLVTAIGTGEADITLTVGKRTAVAHIEVVAAPVVEEPKVYAGMTVKELDAIPDVTHADFDNAMNSTWNIGWDGDGSLTNGTNKIDFDGSTPDSLKWKVKSLDGVGQAINAGWGCELWSQGQETLSEGADVIMYNKIDVPCNVNQFRVWGVGMSNVNLSGNGAFRVKALYKDAAGYYESLILNPVTQVPSYTYDGYVAFTGADQTLPNALDNCMVVYDMSAIKGKTVIISIEFDAGNAKRGTEDTEAAEGVKNGAIMPDCFIVKRVMFLAA